VKRKELMLSQAETEAQYKQLKRGGTPLPADPIMADPGERKKECWNKYRLPLTCPPEEVVARGQEATRTLPQAIIIEDSQHDA